jgi:DNA-binding HxlR family transcriptional regulator
MLSNQLKELEADSLITRHEYSQVPPKVEYYLSERGKSLIPALQVLCKWGAEHIDDEK